MAEWVERLAVAVAAVVAAFLAVAYALPREVTVTRTVEIAAPPATIFALVGDLRRYGEWSPWLTRDPKMAITFTGPLDGVGQTIDWASADPDIGSGRQTITRIEPDSAVEMALVLDERAATTWFNLTGGGVITVTWGLKTDLGASPVARYLGLWIEGTVGPDFERGLARLKAIAEAQPKVG
jgi:hypothetical protein